MNFLSYLNSGGGIIKFLWSIIKFFGLWWLVGYQLLWYQLPENIRKIGIISGFAAVIWMTVWVAIIVQNIIRFVRNPEFSWFRLIIGRSRSK